MLFSQTIFNKIKMSPMCARLGLRTNQVDIFTHNKSFTVINMAI